MPYGRRIGLKTAAAAAALTSGQAEVRSGEMRSVDVDRSADADVGRPPWPVPPTVLDGVQRPPAAAEMFLEGVVRRGPVPPPDTLLD